MKKHIIILSVIALFIVGFSGAVAQSSPEFLISWRADSYVPEWYSGKVLPSAGSNVAVSFELISGGKAVNLSQSAVRWYVNGDLIKNENDGLGIKSIIFSAFPGEKNEAVVKIVIPDYGGASGSVVIPVANPEAAIDSPYPGNAITAGQFVFRAYPFFFNVKNADFFGVSWKVNDAVSSDAGGDPWVLNLDVSGQIPLGSKISLSVVLRNILDIFETASRDIVLNLK